MAYVKRLVLDVLKPRRPNALEFSSTLASLGESYQVKLLLEEMDDQTESVIIEISGNNIDYSAVLDSIAAMGGSVHSIDEVEVHGDGSAATT